MEEKDLQFSFRADVEDVKVMVGEISILEKNDKGEWGEYYEVLADLRRVLNGLFRVTAVIYKAGYIDLYCYKIRNKATTAVDQHECPLWDVWINSGIDVAEDLLPRVRLVNDMFFNVERFKEDLVLNKRLPM